MHILVYEKIIYDAFFPILLDMSKHKDFKALESYLNVIDKIVYNIMREVRGVNDFNLNLYPIDIKETNRLFRIITQINIKLYILEDTLIALFGMDVSDDGIRNKLSFISAEIQDFFHFIYKNYRMYACDIPVTKIFKTEEEIEELKEKSKGKINIWEVEYAKNKN